MTEKLGRQESIARIYLFLSSYGAEKWRTDADTNGKNGVDKVEFTSFMLKHKTEWNGEQKYDAADIINKFWNEVDTNTIGKTSTGCLNARRLTDDEFKAMEKDLEISRIVKDFPEIQNLQLPPGIDKNSTLEKNFKNSIKESLMSKAKLHFSDTKFDPDNKEGFNKEGFINEVNAYLTEVYAESYAITAADYYKNQVLQNAGVEEYGYEASSDKRLNGIIENYIQTIKVSDSIDFTEVKAAIEALVQDYLNSAGVGDGKDYSNTTLRDTNGKEIKFGDVGGYKYYDNAYDTSLNPLQIKVFTQKLTEAIDNALADEKYADYKDIIDDRKTTFIQEQLSSNIDFSKLDETIKNIVDDFLKEIEGEAAKALDKAKENAKEKITKYYNDDKYKSAVQSAFGYLLSAQGNMVSMFSLDLAMEEIDKCTSIKLLNELMDKIEAAISKPEETIVTSDKSDTVKNNVYDIACKTGRLTFRVQDDGTVVFTNWTVGDTAGGVFRQGENSTMNQNFKTVRNELEKTYATELNALFGTDRAADVKKQNLFNIALFMTLSDKSIVNDFYNSINLGNVVNGVIDKYSQLLQKAASDNTVKQYIINYQSSSLLVGRTLSVEDDDEKYIDDVGGNMTHVMNKYFTDESGWESEDWALRNKWIDKCLANEATTWTDKTSGVSGNIIPITGAEGDNQKKGQNGLNRGLVLLLNDYINNYSGTFSQSKIEQLFQQAEKNAFRVLKGCQEKSQPTNVSTTVYGYSEYSKGSKITNARGDEKDYADFDTYSGEWFSGQSVLLQVMFEMEALLAQELLK